MWSGELHLLCFFSVLLITNLSSTLHRAGDAWKCSLKVAWAGLKEAVIESWVLPLQTKGAESQWPPSVAIQNHKAKRGRQELGSCCNKKRSLLPLCCLCALLFGCTWWVGGWWWPWRKCSSERKVGREQGCFTEGAEGSDTESQGQTQTSLQTTEMALYTDSCHYSAPLFSGCCLSFCSLRHPLGPLSWEALHSVLQWSHCTLFIEMNQAVKLLARWVFKRPNSNPSSHI